MYKARPMTHDDAVLLADTMCPEDRLEMLACGYSSPYVPLLRSLCNSHRAYTIMRGGLLVCCFGVVRCGSHGIIWLLSSGMRPHAIQLHKWMPKFLRKLGKNCRTIGNYVPTFQRDHIRWLKRYGFAPSGNTQMRDGLCFVELVKEVGDV